MEKYAGIDKKSIADQLHPTRPGKHMHQGPGRSGRRPRPGQSKKRPDEGWIEDVPLPRDSSCSVEDYDDATDSYPGHPPGPAFPPPDKCGCPLAQPLKKRQD